MARAPDPQSGGSALLTIDVQRDFALLSSPSHVPGTAEAAERLPPLVWPFRSANRPIVHMVRLYLPDGSGSSFGARL